MFTVHTVDRDLNPHGELLRSEYADIVVYAALGVVNAKGDPGSLVRAFGEGHTELVILEDGEPWRYVCLVKQEKVFWQSIPPKEASGADLS